MRKILTGFMYHRMLDLAELEQNEVFQRIYIEILRKAGEEYM